MSGLVVPTLLPNPGRRCKHCTMDLVVVAGTQAWLPSCHATAVAARGQISGDRVRFQQHAARVALTSRAPPPPVGVLSCGVTEVLLAVVGVRDGKAFVADSGRPHCRGIGRP